MPFFSQIAGLPVVDAQGHAQGKIADVVVSADAQYPVITALAVRGGRRDGATLVPWDQVLQFDSTVVLRQAMDQMPSYQPGSRELFVGQQILDRQIVDVEGHKVVRVNDLQLARTNGHYSLIGVDISAQALLRRLGIQQLTRRLGIRPRENFIAWKDVDPLASDHVGLKLRVAHDNLARLHPADLAEIVDQLSVQEGLALFEGMDDEVAAEALEEVAPERQVSLLEGMESGKAADILEEMDPSSAADVLGEMSDEKASELLALMEHEESEDVKELLSYREDSAGGIMTTEYVAVPETWTAAQIMEHLRVVADEIDIVHYIWVVTDLATETLVGMITLRDLILAPPDAAAATFMTRDPLTLHLDDDQDQAAKLIAKYNLMAAPVVDDEGRLKGIVTVDDAIDIILPTAWKKRLPRLFV
ncbi:MAG TPA: CBS domain-containing protein [Chloroflexota bacterium]|nr:CBS domain-containing protein [Chloroflexota bacterium]